MVVAEGADGFTPEVLPLPVDPGPPIELVLPDVSLLLVEPGVVLPPLGPPIALLLPVEPGVVPPPLELPMALLPPVPLLPGVPLVLLLDVDVSGAGFVVVVDELDEDVVGVPVWSRLVHAPSETAAMSASAAHEVRDAFIGNSLRVVRK